MATHQFADGPLNPVAVLHVGSESVGLLFQPSGLDPIMMFADHQSSVRRALAQATRALRASPAEPPVPFETVRNGTGLLLFKPTAVGAVLPGWAHGPSIGHTHGKSLRRYPPFLRRGRRHRPLQFPALRLDPHHFGARCVTRVHIQLFRLLLLGIFPRLFHDRHRRLVRGDRFLRHHRGNHRACRFLRGPGLLLYRLGDLHFVAHPGLVLDGVLGAPLGFGIMRIMHRAGRLRTPLLHHVPLRLLEVLRVHALQQRQRILGRCRIRLSLGPPQQLAHIHTHLLHLRPQLRRPGLIVEFTLHVALPPHRPRLRPGQGLDPLQGFQRQPQGLADAFQSTHATHQPDHMTRIQPLTRLLRQISRLPHRVEHPLKAQTFQPMMHQPIPELHQRGRMEPRLIHLHLQRQLPPPVPRTGFRRLPVRQPFHELQDRHPRHPHRLFRRTPIIQAVHRLQLRTQLQQLRPNPLGEEHKPLRPLRGRRCQSPQHLIRVEERPLLSHMGQAHRKSPLDDGYLI